MYCFYINLDRRQDRRIQVEETLTTLGIQGERFTAIAREPGGIGCTQSHIAVLKLARERNYPSVLIFEDDFEALVTKEVWDETIANIPDVYDVIFVTYNIQRSEPFNDRFGKVIEGQTAAGYIVHNTYYDTLIARLEEGLVLYEEYPEYHWLYINDQYWKQLQPVGDWYYTLLRLGRQRAGYSDLSKTFVDHHNGYVDYNIPDTTG
jgi:glycosyl transferase family 25